MIEVTYINAYTGNVHEEELNSLKVSSFNEVLIYANNTLQNKYNTCLRICIYSDDATCIKQIPLILDNINIDDIDSVFVEYTVDMCPIIQVICKKSNGIEYIHDYYRNLFELSEGDIVFNKRDGRFYYIIKDPNIYSLQDVMWNDDIPSSHISKYDIHKATEFEYEYYHLDRLVSLRTASNVDEYNKILDSIFKNHPRLIT